RLGVLEHLPVTGRVAERRVGAAANHQVDALGLAGIVVVEQQFGLFNQDRLPVLVVVVSGAACGANDLLRRDAIHAVGIHPHPILTAAGDDIGPVAAGT